MDGWMDGYFGPIITVISTRAEHGFEFFISHAARACTQYTMHLKSFTSETQYSCFLGRHRWLVMIAIKVNIQFPQMVALCSTSMWEPMGLLEPFFDIISGSSAEWCISPPKHEGTFVVTSSLTSSLSFITTSPRCHRYRTQASRSLT